MNLVDIENRLSPADPTIRIYPSRCTLNAATLRLLGLSGQAFRVFIRQDMQQAFQGRKRVYICRSDKGIGYMVKRRGNRGIINSVSLSKKLAELLNGYGAYRVCEEVFVREGEQTWYEIFFRKYD